MNQSTATILLVEDDPKSVVLTRRAAQKARLPVSLQAVGSVRSARAYLTGEGIYADRDAYPLPQMVLLDIHLPDGSGHELLAWMRARAEWTALPVVMLTASGAPRNIQQALASGASSYLLKPVDPDALADLIHGLALPLEKPPRILMIDDDERLRELVAQAFRRECQNVIIDQVSTADEFSRALEKDGYDLVITDYVLPWIDGLAIVRACKAHWRECPVIMFTASGDEQVAAQGMRAGLDDYIIKSPAHMARLCGAVRLLIGRRRLRDARREAVAALAHSERRFRRLFEFAIEGIVIIDAEALTIVDANPALCKLLGYTHAQLAGQHPWMLAPEGYADKRRADMMALTSKGHGKHSEATLRRADGTLITVERDSSLYSAGNRRLVQCHIRDISERKAAEEGMRRALAQAQNYLDIVPVMVLLLDREGRVARVNRRGAEIVGCPEGDLIGKSWIDHFVPENSRIEVRQIWGALLSGEAPEMGYRETEMLTCAGDVRLMAWNNSVLQDERGQVIGVLSAGDDITERRRTEEALRNSEATYRALVDNMEDSVHLKDRLGRYVMANQEMTRALGITPRDIIGKTALDIYPEPYGSEVYADDMRVMETGKLLDKEEHSLDGLVWLRKVPIRNANGEVTGIVSVARNIEERRQLEEQLRQAQKMEAVGRLAGGIAHDFNNLLTVINGYSGMLLDGLAPSAPMRDELRQIQRAGERAAGLTRQLLTFSRRRTAAPQVVQPNSLLIDLQHMLSRVIGEDIRLEVHLDPGLGAVLADPGQIEQAIMNLAVNARDAMPDGGTLTVSTRNVELSDAFALEHPEIEPGSFVRLSVTDTGMGMSDEVQEHLFEPFFTTKEVGKGTGLGLATVWGIVNECQGCVDVESTLGVGSTFSILLPRTKDTAQSGRGDEVPPQAAKGHESILVVEDQDAVRMLTVRMLGRLGYHVLQAESGAAAIEIVACAEHPIQLVLTDVIMPEMGGQELARILTSRHPGVQVLFMSGYTDRAESLRQANEFGCGLLEKPFTLRTLRHQVREALDSAPN